MDGAAPRGAAVGRRVCAHSAACTGSADQHAARGRARRRRAHRRVPPRRHAPCPGRRASCECVPEHGARAPRTEPRVVPRVRRARPAALLPHAAHDRVLCAARERVPHAAVGRAARGRAPPARTGAPRVCAQPPLLRPPVARVPPRHRARLPADAHARECRRCGAVPHDLGRRHTRTRARAHARARAPAPPAELPAPTGCVLPAAAAHARRVRQCDARGARCVVRRRGAPPRRPAPALWLPAQPARDCAWRAAARGRAPARPAQRCTT